MSSYILFLILGLGVGRHLRHPRPGTRPEVPQRRRGRLRARRRGDVHRLRLRQPPQLRGARAARGPDPAPDLAERRHRAQHRARDRHLAGVRGGPRAGAVRPHLPAAAGRLAAHPGLRVGRRDARPAGDRGAQLQHRARGHQPDLPEFPAVDRQDHVPGGPPVLHRRGDRHLGRARARLPLLPVRPGHPGRRRERPGGRADRHLGQPHRGAELGDRHGPGGRGRHPDRPGRQPRSDLLHPVRRAGPGGRADRPVPVVLDHRAGRPPAGLRAVRDREAHHGLDLVAPAGPVGRAPVHRHHRGDGAALAHRARPRRGDGRAQPLDRPPAPAAAHRGASASRPASCSCWSSAASCGSRSSPR